MHAIIQRLRKLRRLPVSNLPLLAKALDVSIEALIGGATKTAAKRGPAPKLQQQLEQLSRLPKTQQRMVNRGRGAGPLMPSVFLQEINEAIPAHAGLVQAVTTADIFATYRHRIPGGDEPYFAGWCRNPKGKTVRPKNLDKTRRCFGQQVRDGCERQNISSCWSPHAAEGVDYFPPPLGP